VATIKSYKNGILNSDMKTRVLKIKDDSGTVIGCSRYLTTKNGGGRITTLSAAEEAIISNDNDDHFVDTAAGRQFRSRP
jgi:hypothetical protein